MYYYTTTSKPSAFKQIGLPALGCLCHHQQQQQFLITQEAPLLQTAQHIRLA